MYNNIGFWKFITDWPVPMSFGSRRFKQSFGNGYVINNSDSVGLFVGVELFGNIDRTISDVKKKISSSSAPGTRRLQTL